MESLINELESLKDSHNFGKILQILAEIQPKFSKQDFQELVSITSNFKVLEDISLICELNEEYLDTQLIFLYIHGKELQNIYKRIDYTRLIEHLEHHYVILLFQEILKAIEINLDELHLFKAAKIHALFVKINENPQETEFGSDGLIFLILLNYQYMRKVQNFDHILNEFLSPYGMGHRKELSLLLIMVFNRAGIDA